MIKKAKIQKRLILKDEMADPDLIGKPIFWQNKGNKRIGIIVAFDKHGLYIMFGNSNEALLVGFAKDIYLIIGVKLK